jgi:hypothetical protein
MNYADFIRQLITTIPLFTEHFVHTKEVARDYFLAAQQFLQLHKKTMKVPNFPTSVTWRVDFCNWLQANKIECPLEFDNGEDEVAYMHDILILAAASLNIRLIAVPNCLYGMGNNPAYKLGLKAIQH